MKKFVLLIFVLLFIMSCAKPKEEPEKIDPFIYRTDVLEEGETLANALMDEGLDNGLVYKLVNKLDSLYDLRHAHPNDSFTVKLDSLDILHELSFKPDQVHNYRVIRDTSNIFYTQIDTLKLLKEITVKEGEIHSSLWQGMSDEGIDPATIVMFTQIFQWDIDFFIDPQKGDEFHIVYEKNMDENGNFVKAGNILAANYSSKNYNEIAYRYTNKKNETRYYDNNGKCIQKAFLKSPLNYKRISSYFGSRYHPITKKTRFHNGVDYAASYGTPVEASADGTIIHRGWKGGHPTVNGKTGGYGKTIMIRHGNGYKTLYGHLSSYGKYREGARVKQHDIIGYVGSTGLSTGNHLHYTIYHYNKAINPLKLKNVSGPPVPKNEMNNFLASIESLQRFFIAGSTTDTSK
ncbi:MAG: M23 family metallopeptidase [Candidatus Tenebribacter davisii]|jgi:murein DD-endopeptidase MepM/ murein hydrolase activator NlpD|nr:M23 family metallopeptidase [Candidatus Tenebribacter davisii]